MEEFSNRLVEVISCTDKKNNPKQQHIVGTVRRLTFPHWGYTAWLGYEGSMRGRTTSTVSSIESIDNIIEITTINTIYSLKKVGK